MGTLVRVIGSGKQVLDEVMLEIRRMVAESILLIEREDLAGPDYYPTHPGLQKLAHEAGSAYMIVKNWIKSCLPIVVGASFLSFHIT